MTTLTLRRGLTTTATVGVLLAATACSDNSSTEQAPTTSASAPASTPASASASPTGSDRSTPMHVTIDGQEVEATLNDSPAARDLASLLPLTLDLEDFHGTERIADPPRKLTTENAPEPQAPRTGDLTYYAPGATSPSSTRTAPPPPPTSWSSATSTPTPTNSPGPTGSPSRPPPDLPQHRPSSYGKKFSHALRHRVRPRQAALRRLGARRLRRS